MSTFHVKDFSCSTDWEKCMAKLEAILTKLPQQQQQQQHSTDGPVVTEFSLDEDDYALYLVNDTAEFHAAKEENSNLGTGLRILEVFGLGAALLVLPQQRHGLKMSVTSKLLGALTTAANAASCPIPVFVPYGDLYRQTVLGIRCGSLSPVRYHLDVRADAPREISTRWECLWDAFVALIGMHKPINEDTMQTQLMQTFQRVGAPTRQWEELLVVENDREAAPKAVDNWRPAEPPTLSWGTAIDPIKELQFRLIWETARDDIALDREKAAHVSVSVRSTPPDVYQCYLGEHVREMCDAFLRTFRVEVEEGNVGEGVEDIFLSAKHRSGISNTLSNIFHASVKGTSHRGRRGSSSNLKQVDDDAMAQLIDSIFSDEVTPDVDQFLSSKFIPRKGTVLEQYPPGTLLALFAHQMACAHDVLTPDVITAGWAQLCHRLVRLFEASLSAPHVPKGLPNWDCNETHQRLQLINYVITRCSSKMSPSKNSVTSAGAVEGVNNVAGADVSAAGDGWADFGDDDEMMDALSDDEQPLPKAVGGGDATHHGFETVDGKTLIKDKTVPLRVPTFATRSVMTSGMMESVQDDQSLVASGNKEASERWQEQKTQQHNAMMRDMVAFRHANENHPKLCFLDFVSWYSPADISLKETDDDNTEESALSTRMRAADTPWRLAWEASAVAALTTRQDDATEMDVVPAQLSLRWLESLPERIVVQHTLHYLVSNALYTLSQTFSARHVPYLRDEFLPAVVDRVTSALPAVMRRDLSLARAREAYGDVADVIEYAERLVSLATSLFEKISSHRNTKEQYHVILGFIGSVLRRIAEVADFSTTVRVDVPFDVWGVIMDRAVLGDARPISREYCLTVNTKLGNTCRLHCIIAPSEFTCATAIADV